MLLSRKLNYLMVMLLLNDGRENIATATVNNVLNHSLINAYD